MTSSALFVLACVAFPGMADERPGIVALPVAGADDNAVLRASIDSTFDGALYTAASMRGLKAVRLDRVRGVREQALACTDDVCRVDVARRLGARFFLKSESVGPELRVFLVDADAQAPAAPTLGISVAGRAARVLAQIPSVVDALVEDAMPRSQHARAQALDRALRAQQAGDVVAADALYREAIIAGPIDDDAAEAFLLRARMLDASHDHVRAAACWDELAATFAEGTTGHARLSASQQQRMTTAIDDHVLGLAARLLVDTPE